MMLSRSTAKAAITHHGGGKSRLIPTTSTIHRLKSSGCPVTGPILKKVPTLPFVGSMIPQHSGLPVFQMSRQYEFNSELRQKFGEFIHYGIPGFGVGLHGHMYTIFDPNEMAKVVRSEGAYPSGLIEKLWQWRRAMLESGEGWKRHRTFLQTGMLDPVAARGFLPGIVLAAESASSVAPLHSHNVNEYMNYTAFDMFCSFMFGKQMNTTSTSVSTDPTVKGENKENEQFVTAALGVFEKTNAMSLFPLEFIMAKFFP
eukprot:scaffold19891_cov139-Skeletonema_marinoi.AAC.6